MNRRKHSPERIPPAWRAALLLGLFAFAAVALEARLAWLQLVDVEFLTAEGEKRQLREVRTPAHRGLITDRHGEPLAVSTPLDSIVANPQTLTLEPARIHALAEAIGLEAADIERRITSNRHQKGVYLSRQLAPAHAAKVLELGIEGVWAEREYGRFNPAHEVTCHLVGFTDIDDIGQEGLEAVYDHRLAGRPGLKLVQRDEKGRVIADVEQTQQARPGRDLRSSIDLRLQYPAYRALKQAVLETGASSGSLVILDAMTGEVLAMANQPSCNPNDGSQRQAERYRNRAITDPIEPGSSIKPLVLAAALASGYSPGDLIDVPRDLEIGGQLLTSDPTRLGTVTISEVLARSSNVGMALIAQDLDRAVIWRTLKALGISESTNSELSGIESAGSLPEHERWGERGLATLAYGYGLQVTPLQLARAYTAIASGGLLPPVSFEALDEPPESVRVMSPEIAADLLSMLEGVVSDNGTARRAAIPNYNVAGKTGTVRIHERGGYSDDRYRAIFAGIAPARHPRFVAVVVINDPRGAEYYGGDLAAPVFASVVGAALRIYGVAPDALTESRPAAEQLARAEASR